MTDTIESFVEKLKNEGVEAGQKEADQLKQQAQEQMDRTVADAKHQAEKIIADAQAEAQSIIARSQTELELAARDAALKMRESLTKALQTVMTKPINDQLSDADFLKSLLSEMAAAYVQADVKGGGSVKVNVSPEMAQKLSEWALGKIQAAGREADIALTDSLKQAGFECTISGGTVEITQSSVTESLMELVGPNLRKVFDQAMSAGKE